jgi:IS30 family transposase
MKRFGGISVVERPNDRGDTATAGARISDRVSIHDRPQDADSKQQFGNWEGDLLAFCRNSQQALVGRAHVVKKQNDVHA